MKGEQYHVDVESAQEAHHAYHCCGDVFISHRQSEAGRVVVVLSDGLGSGAVANVLATLTASMAMSFTLGCQAVERTAQIIMDTLPMDHQKKLSYATFVIADIESDGETHIIEFDNPPVLLLRKGVSTPLPREVRQLETQAAGNRQMNVSHFYLNADDRLVLVSDGITQSGMGRASMPFGYGLANVSNYLERILARDETISSRALSRAVVRCARTNDMLQPQDDMTCGVVHFRKPRELLLCTGPPFNENRDQRMAERVRDFKGRKIICGGTTSQIVSRLLGVPLEVQLGVDTAGLPAISRMPGIDLVTEGVITLSRVAAILANMSPYDELDGPGPAWEIVRMLHASDIVHFMVGTRINISHYDPDLPIELEARRTLVRRIVRILEERFLKEINVEFI